MSSSKGNVLSISRILEVVPPEALRYMIIRDRPQRTIGFDPGLPLLQLVDQLDDRTARGRDARAVELSQAAGFEPVGVPFKHLVVVAQVADFDTDKVVRILKESGYPDARRDAVAGRLHYARNWLEAYAPEDLKFTVQPTLPPQVEGLDDEQRRFLGRLAAGLQRAMDGPAVHDLIYELAGSFEGIPASHLFQAIYLSLLGKQRGPRAGAFVAILGADFCRARFAEASGGLE
jgi:lysyl-tRNA synthetase class 1